MFVSIIRWLATMAIQHGAKAFFAHVYDDLVGMMMSVWKWLCEKTESVCSWIRGLVKQK